MGEGSANRTSERASASLYQASSRGGGCNLAGFGGSPEPGLVLFCFVFVLLWFVCLFVCLFVFINLNVVNGSHILSKWIIERHF